MHCRRRRDLLAWVRMNDVCRSFETFRPETDRIAARVRALSETCPFGFWFLTDLHVPSNHGASAPLLERLIAESGLRVAACGGDIPEAFGDRASLDASIGRYRDLWVASVERAGGGFFPLRGNHDFAIRSAPDSSDGFTYPEDEARRILLDTAAVRSRATVDPGSCAYFADFPEARFRLVAADTSDSVTDERPYWGVEESMSERQSRWLSDNALATLPAGWRVVVASHIPFAGVAASDFDKEKFAPIRAALESLNADGRGRVALALSGHYHAELQSSVKGVWHVTEPCDAAYLDYINRSAPWCPELPVKEPGTWVGQTFDAVQIDPERGLVHFTRVGGGSDRVLHVDPVSLRAGETVRLATCESAPKREPELQGAGGAPVWGAYDAARAVSRPNPVRKYDRFTDYFNTVAEISPDGVLRALAPGEAVAVARSPGGFREYFPVRVAAPDCR